MNEKMKVVQCWDDGFENDIRVADILRKHGAKATFNLNSGGIPQHRGEGEWEYKGIRVAHLGWDEVQSVYEGFVIASHGKAHLVLSEYDEATQRAEIHDCRAKLQDFFQQPVLGFAYPCGRYNETTKKLLREEGHIYARTVVNVEQCFPPKDPFEFHPNCHYLAPDFWERFEKARSCGVFYFWGHSYEMINDEMFRQFEEKIERISSDQTVEWTTLPELFAK